MKTDKLDAVFSEYIRRRDASPSGYGKCISCGKIIHWKGGDAGHYVDRKHMSLRYDEQNVNLQCRDCNSFQLGNIVDYANGLEAKYGKHILDVLSAKKRQTKKYSQSDIDGMVEYYKQKIKELDAS